MNKILYSNLSFHVNTSVRTFNGSMSHCALHTRHNARIIQLAAAIGLAV